MDSTNSIQQARKALKLINEIEESDRRQGLDLLVDVLRGEDSMLIDYGYKKLIMKELSKVAKFETPSNLKLLFKILRQHYTQDECDQDEIMETLLYIYGLTSNFDIAQECVDQISALIDLMNDNVAKHSKQIMQAAEINTFISLNERFVEVLEKLKKKLPQRKTSS